MIVDCHTHLVDFELEIDQCLRDDMRRCRVEAHWQVSKADYLAATEQADCAIVFGIRAAQTGWLCSNERLAETVKRMGEKYIFFASIDPSEPDFLEQLRHAHLVLGAEGIKLGPVYQGVHPHDPRYHAIYAYCERNNLPIITHMAATFTKGVPLSYAHPILMDDIACQYPDLTIVLAHMGHPWIDETISIVRKQPNVYADVSALYYRPMQFYRAMRSAEEYGASEKLLFGSDYPATTTSKSIEGLLSVNHIIRDTNLPQVSLAMMREILHRDTLRILGIKQREVSAHTL